MAHFAEVDADNTVLRVLVVANEQEHRGQEFLADDLGLGGNWIQTSYNDNFRGRFAGVGFKYYPELDAFAPPQPYPSWTLNEETWDWEAPVPYPVGGKYEWDEDTLTWMEIIGEQ